MCGEVAGVTHSGQSHPNLVGEAHLCCRTVTGHGARHVVEVWRCPKAGRRVREDIRDRVRGQTRGTDTIFIDVRRRVRDDVEALPLELPASGTILRGSLCWSKHRPNARPAGGVDMLITLC